MTADRALIGVRCEIRKRHFPKEVGRLTHLRPSKFANGMDRGLWQTCGRFGRLFLKKKSRLCYLGGRGGIGMHELRWRHVVVRQLQSSPFYTGHRLQSPMPFVCNFSNPFSRAFSLAKSALVTQYGKYGNGKLLL